MFVPTMGLFRFLLLSICTTRRWSALLLLLLLVRLLLFPFDEVARAVYVVAGRVTDSQAVAGLQSGSEAIILTGGDIKVVIDCRSPPRPCRARITCPSYF